MPIAAGSYSATVEARNLAGAFTDSFTIKVSGGNDYVSISIKGMSGNPSTYNNSGLLLSGDIAITKRTTNPTGPLVVTNSVATLPGHQGSSPAKITINLSYSGGVWKETVTVSDNGLNTFASKTVSGSDPASSPTPNGASDTIAVGAYSLTWTAFDNDVRDT